MVGDGLNCVTSPAAWHVDPLVSSPFSMRWTSRTPALARWYATLQPVMPPPMTTAPAWSALSIGARRLGIPRPPPVDRFGQQRREVDDLELRACGAHPVVEHHGAERAGDRQGLGAGARRLAHALLVDGPASPLLHPHTRAAGAAAKRALAVPRHLHRVACRRYELARRLADVVVAREIARVVICELSLSGQRFQSALAHEPGQELGVMNDLVPPPEVRVLRADGV